MNSEKRGDETYDAVPYHGRAIALTHPCHVAAVARLSGLAPPPPDRCRVLELGCAVGTNLLPMAEGLPDSRFVGVDLSRQQIELAQSSAGQACIGNVELVRADIGELDDSLGQFDYIICHGVYSWVQEDVQARILDLGARLLGPQGLMYVSYNVYPGWHLRGAIREMMLRHVADRPTASEQIAQARGLIRFLAESAMPLRGSYGALLKEELEAIESSSDHYLYHDQLERTNAPVYFEDFVRRAEASGLTYVSDADITTMFAQHFGDAAATMLLGAPLVRREQYMDYLRGRMFRASLLRRPGPATRPEAAGAANLLALHVRMAVPFEAGEGAGGATVWKHGAKSMTTGPEATALFRRLRQHWPQWLAVQELLEDSRAGGAPPAAAERVLGELFAALSHGAVVAAAMPPKVCGSVQDAPRCTPLAGVHAAQGEWVVSRHHQSVRCDSLSRFLLSRLDGTKRRPELVSLLEQAIRAGDIVVRDGDHVLGSLDRTACARIVERQLALLANSALLVG